MKKILMIFAMAALISSCVVDNRASHDNAWSLEFFGEDLVSRSTVRCVRSFYGAMNDTDVNAEGFSTTMSFDDGMTVSVERVADGSWSMRCDEGRLQFSLRLGMDDPANELSDWTCSSFAASYDEGNGFTAVLVSDGDIRFSWEYNASGALWQLDQSGRYVMETYYEDSALDTCFLKY